MEAIITLLKGFVVKSSHLKLKVTIAKILAKT